jgi:branched-chain amino acid transport system substrate-binding protein
MKRICAKRIVVCLCGAVIIFLAGGGAIAALAADTVKIGVLDPRSGQMEPFGRAWHASMQFVVDEQNAKGGLLGKKVELVTEDGEAKPDVATRKARKLILEDKVSFLTGGHLSPVAIALARVAASSKVLYFNYSGMADEIQGKEFSPYAFRVCQNHYEQFTSLIMLLARTPYRKFYSIQPDYLAGHSQDERLKEELPKYIPDGKVVGTDFHPFATRDFAPYITKIISSGADAIVTGTYGSDLINLIRQARSMGLKSTFPIFAPLGLHPYSIGELKEAAVGMYYTSEYLLRVNTPENRDFIKRYHEKHENDKDFLTQWPFSDIAMAIFGWKMTFAAVEKAGSLDPDKIIAAYEGFEWKSPVGAWTMRKCDHQVLLPMFGGSIAAGPNPFYSFPWEGTKVEEIPADKVTLPATKDYNPRCP